MAMFQDIFIRNGCLEVPGAATPALMLDASPALATILSNLATYGYTLDRSAYLAVESLDDLPAWWESVEPVLADITGANRNMGEFMVYKNFPGEVLDMDASTQVMHQLLIYWGVPYDLLRQPEVPRPMLGDVSQLKVLTLAGESTAADIIARLIQLPNRWSDHQADWAQRLFDPAAGVSLTDFGFKENGVRLAAQFFAEAEISVSSATDVLRLCAALSGGDVSLRERFQFRGFKRPERRRLLALLDEQAQLTDDMAARPELWKRLMEHLRPGDYRYRNVTKAYDQLYKSLIKSFSSIVDPQLPTPAALDALATRPGEFLRRLHHFYEMFGGQAVDRFIAVMDRLTSKQLAGFRAYLRTINDRQTLIYPPRANWGKAQVAPNAKQPLQLDDVRRLNAAISGILSQRLAKAFPEGLDVDPEVARIRFQTNDQKLAEYGRGTEFDIPPRIQFVRSASYWQQGGNSVTWFDNSWNFFDGHWEPLGVCAWNNQHGPVIDQQPDSGKAAIFSGDPVNITDLKGRACQMADLYLDRLGNLGVRFAVWSILCFSNIPFSMADEVLATLQWGEDAETGNTYEPSRAQMVFPLKSSALTSYVAYLDLVRRKLVYMDAALPSNVHSAWANTGKLSEIMPAYLEYLNSLPTVLDLVQDAPKGSLPVRYSDAEVPITAGRAFVFRPENVRNSFARLSLADLIDH